MRRISANPEDVTLPHPSLLGIEDPVAAARAKRTPQAASAPPSASPGTRSRPPAPERSPEPTDLKIVPAAEEEQPGSAGSSSSKKSRWHAVKAAPADLRKGTSGN